MLQNKIGFLRQWLNEERITDPNKLVTDEELMTFLIDEVILEDKNFRVNSDGWTKIIVDGKEYLEAPTKDIWEINEGELKGEQLFTWEASVRETKIAGKRMPTDEEFNLVIFKKYIFPKVGHRSTSGTFGNRGTYAYLWSSSVSGSNAWDRHLYYGSAGVFRYPNSQAFGFSVRCIKV